MGISYYESNDGNFRGVGFFAFEGQDINFIPHYRVALINPNTRAIVVFDFPLNNHPTLLRFVPADNETDSTIESKIKELYSYLNDAENYQGTDLASLVEAFANIVASLKILN